MTIFDNITQTIGRTPLVRLKNILENSSDPLYAEVILKLEFFNPLGSVKDRIGLSMIEDAEKKGLLKKGSKLIEPTSGNTGIALAFICASKGYSLTLVMPETMSQERRTLLLLLGAEVIITPGPLGMRGAIAKVLEIVENDPNTIYLKQFENPANPTIHMKTTALEILEDTKGNFDFFVAGVGTGGTISGVGKILKEKNKKIKIIAVEPTESAVISGEKPGPHKIQGIGAGFIPKNLDQSVLDGVEKVSSSEAVSMAKRLIKEEGIPVGISSGAAVEAALRIARKPENKGKKIIVLLASHTERYLSTVLGEDEKVKAMALSVTPVNDAYLSKVEAQESSLKI